MQTLNDVHHQFASFFMSETLQPYAYLVSKKLAEGHICLPLNSLEEELEALPQKLKTLSSVRVLLSEPMINAAASSKKQPFVVHNNQLYLQRYFNYETMILERIRKLIGDENESAAARLLSLSEHRGLIQTLFTTSAAITGTDWALTAAVSGVLNNFTIITGGPGTGKTTTVAKILAILYSMNADLKVALAAPTGKAAARMGESLKGAKLEVGVEITGKFQALQPSTIHRLLGPVRDSPYFKHNRNNPLPYDLLIIDESSMIDVALFAKLLDAIAPQTRLIMLGDKDQLASVEAGSLFGDLCQAQHHLNIFGEGRASFINSFIESSSSRVGIDAVSSEVEHPLFQHIIELRHSHRFLGDGGIGRFSKAVIETRLEVLHEFLGQPADEQVLIDTSYSSGIFGEFVKGYEAYIAETDIRRALAKFNELRILCAVREGEQGLYTLNRKVEKYLSDRRLIKISSDFYEHRPLIVTGNNYALELYNGDVGIVRKDEKGVLKAWFEDAEGELRSVIPGLLSQVETVYAMTIHKSQGSEFNRVLVVLPQAENIAILTRELLYTGVTRARQEVLLQGSEAVIMQAASRRVQRASGIAGRFTEQLR